MITDELKTKLVEAMKARNEVRVTTLRSLSAALNNAKIDNPEMTEEDEMKVVQSEVKKRRDAIEVYEKAGAQMHAQREKEELAVLEEFLPQQISDSELEKIVTKVIEQIGASNIQDMGKVMGAVMSQVSGKADGARVSTMVKRKLT